MHHFFKYKQTKKLLNKKPFWKTFLFSKAFPSFLRHGQLSPGQLSSVSLFAVNFPRLIVAEPKKSHKNIIVLKI